MDKEFADRPDAKSGSKKIMLFFLLALVLPGGGGVAAYLSGMLDSDDAHEESAEAEALPPPPSPNTVFCHLPTMISNVAGERGSPRFLKYTLSLAVNDINDVPKIRDLEPRILDILQVYFRDLRLDDLRESQGIPILRQALLTRINSIIHPAVISSVLLTEILIQ